MRHWAEEVARQYLIGLGYPILAENYHMRGAELDLIAKDGDTLVFVEVRQRSSSHFGSPAESIRPAKMQRLRKAALHYTTSCYGRDDLLMRFDAILLEGSQDKYQLEHLKNAF